MIGILILLLAGSPEPVPTPSVDVAAVRAQSRTLTLAGKWEQALALLDAADGRAGTDAKAHAALTTERGRVLMDANFFHHRDSAPARAALEEGRRLGKSAGDRAVMADADQYLAQLSYNAAFDTKDWKTPRAAFEKVLGAREKLGDRRGLSETFFYVGLTYEQDGQPDQAFARYEKSLALAEQTGDLVQQSYARRHIGGIQQERGEFDAAQKNIDLELELRRQGGFVVGVPFALLHLADFRSARGAAAEDIDRILEEAVSTAQGCGSTRALFAASSELSRRAAAAGDARRAFALGEQALKAARAYGGSSEIREAESLINSAGRALPN